MRRALLSVPALLVVLSLSAAGCRPKGSDKAPTIQQGSVDEIILKHPVFFEARLKPKLTHEKEKWPVQLEYSSFPDKSAIVVDGKPTATKRSGEVPTSIDLGATIGDLPIAALTGISGPVPVNVPVEMTFFDKRQKVSHVFTQLHVTLELERCMKSPPCVFPNDGPPNAPPNAPNIVSFARGSSMSSGKAYGSPVKVRDVDWVAFHGETDPVDGKKCEMKRLAPGTSVNDLTDAHTLKRAVENITVYDRRTGAKLHERTVVAQDRCPLYADIKLSGPKSGLRSELTDTDRDRVFEELRGGPPAGPAASASSASPAPSAPTKQKHKKRGTK